MKRSILRLFGMSMSLALLLAASASAHHSAAMFDHTRRATLKGWLKEIKFENPHAFILLMVPGPSGKAVTWAVQFGGGGESLFKMGFRRNYPAVGDKITVVAYPLRDGRHGGSFISLTTADGRVLGFRPGGGHPAPSRQ